MKRILIVAAASAGVAAALPTPATAGELESSLVGSAAATSWQDDTAIGSTGRVGLRFTEHVTVFGLGHLAYGSKHRRLITRGGLGARLGTRVGVFEPHLAAAVLLQQERALSDVADDPIGDPFMEDGSRPGGFAAIGADLPLWRGFGLELFATGELTVTRLFAAEGPAMYWAAGAGLGFRIDLAHAAFAGVKHE